MDKINEIILKLPLPPSVNKAYLNTKYGRTKSESYKNYIEQLRFEFLKLPNFEIIGDEFLECKYEFYFKIFNKNGTIKKRDTFNFEKVLNDSLCLFIYGFRDEKIKRGIVEKIDSEDEYCKVYIKEIEKKFYI